MGKPSTHFGELTMGADTLIKIDSKKLPEKSVVLESILKLKHSRGLVEKVFEELNAEEKVITLDEFEEICKRAAVA